MRKIAFRHKIKKNPTVYSVNFSEKVVLRIMFEKKIVNLQVEVLEI